MVGLFTGVSQSGTMAVFKIEKLGSAYKSGTVAPLRSVPIGVSPNFVRRCWNMFFSLIFHANNKKV
jgi:hypothetical protein